MGEVPLRNVLLANLLLTYLLQDRFAETWATPPIDKQQDWTLLTADEEDGYTILEFTRKLITCDNRDLDITVRCYESCVTVDPFSDVWMMSCSLKLLESSGAITAMTHLALTLRNSSPCMRVREQEA